MSLRKMVSIALMAILIPSVGCQKESLNEVSSREPGNGQGKISLVASMPGGDALKAGYSNTRVAFEQKGLAINLTWEEGDVINLCFVQDDRSYSGIASAKNISNQGGTAEFSFALPEQIKSGTFDLYGVYGGKGLSTDDLTTALLPDNSGNGSLASIQESEDMMLYFASEGVQFDNPKISVNLEHLGSFFSVTLLNSGTTAITGLEKIDLISDASNSGWAYNHENGGGSFDLVNGVFLNTAAGNNISFKTEKNSIESGETLEVWGWYPILPDVVWPELKLEMKDALGNTIGTSSNSKPARTEATKTGRAYYFNAEWNGVGLKFVEADNLEPVNIIRNGGFEESLAQSSINTIYGFEYTTLVRTSGFFDEISQKTQPTLDDAVPVTDYMWFKKAANHYQILAAINPFRNASSGTKSFFLLNSGGRTIGEPTGYLDQTLAQRVSLDDNKKYQFSFHALKRENASDNSQYTYPFVLNEIYVGIVPSTHDTKPYIKELPLSQEEEWSEVSVIFDLPAIIAETEGMSFDKCAVFIGIVSGYSNGKTVRVRIDIDDVSLAEVE